MFGVPALVMMIAYYVVLPQLFTFQAASDKMLYAGIAGICSVQIVIVGFLVHAFTESDDGAATTAAEKKSD